MRLLLDGNELPLFNKMSIKKEDALATNRGQSGNLNVDRSYKRNVYSFSYDFFDLADYNIIETLYERQFVEGAFFRLQLVDSEVPIDTQVFIEPVNIVPRFGGVTMENYTLELIQR